MEPLKNPFSPGAGTPPPELAGREPILDKARIALGRIKAGRPEKSFLLVGLRGVGKTVLLNEIEKIAKETGYKTIQIEAHENKSLSALLLPPIRQLLFELDRMAMVNEKVKRAISVLRSFLNKIYVKGDNFEFGLDIAPETGTADSGDIESDLPALFEVIGEAAAVRDVAVAVFMDELQYLPEIELSALIMAFHRISQKGLPLVLVGAGLPQLVALVGRSKSYAERLFDYPAVGPLQKEDAEKALQSPVKEQGVAFTESALEEILLKTGGYPYFIQEWGYQAWNIARINPIDLHTIQEATDKSIQQLDQGFFRVRFDRLTPSEKRYLRALAEMGNGAHRSGDIADILGIKAQSVSPIRNNLIKKGMIYSPAHGDTEFTVPLFDQFMKRAMPVVERYPAVESRRAGR